MSPSRSSTSGWSIPPTPSRKRVAARQEATMAEEANRATDNDMNENDTEQSEISGGEISSGQYGSTEKL